MSEKKIKTRIQQKHDVEANWITAGNNGFIPMVGELIVYDADSTHDYERFKIGDGKTVVDKLPFASPAQSSLSANSLATPNNIEGARANIAGARGYYWTRVNPDTNTLVIAAEQDGGGEVSRSEFLKWATVGSWVSIVNNKHYDRCAQIIDASQDEMSWHGVITLSELPFTERVEPDADEEPAEVFLNYAIINLDHPELGEVDFGKNSQAFGLQTTAIGLASFAEGYDTRAEANGAHAEGRHSKAIGRGSHSEGYYSEAQGAYSHAEGQNTVSVGNNSHAEGYYTTTDGNGSHAEGRHSKAMANGAHAEGYKTSALGAYAHAEGNETVASVANAHAEGKKTSADGNAAHAEGYLSTASAQYAHAEGHNTKATAEAAHAEGNGAEAHGKGSHAEGLASIAISSYAHAEGQRTKAIQANSHAEGKETIADGNAAHAEGYKTHAVTHYSHASGEGTITGRVAQTVVGTYNTVDTSALFIVGDGTSEDARSNAFTAGSNSEDGAYITVGNTKFTEAQLAGGGCFIAEYASTDYAEIMAAVNTGRFVVCRVDEDNLPYYLPLVHTGEPGDDCYYFKGFLAGVGVQDRPYVITVSIDADNLWSNIDVQDFALANAVAAKSEGTFFIVGSGTTDSTAKTSTWTGTSGRITSYYDGLTIKYKIGVAGQTTTTLNINNLGAKTVYLFNTTKLTTQFPVNSIIHLTYHADLNGGCWICNDYDANTNTYQRVYPTTTNTEYPITTRYNTTTGSSYYAEYGRYSTGVTLNPSTNTITADNFVAKENVTADIINARIINASEGMTIGGVAVATIDDLNNAIANAITAALNGTYS